MTPEEIKQLTDKFKLITLASLETEVAKGALTLQGYIQKQIHAGISPQVLKANLIADLENGGQIFGSLRSAFRKQVAWGVEGAEDSSLKATQGINNDTMEDWVAIADGATCDGCMSNANAGSNPHSYWVSAGLPSAGSNECGDYCRCDLVKSGAYTDEMKLNASTRYEMEKYNASHDKQINFMEAQTRIQK